jgi:hypothetical protein
VSAFVINSYAFGGGEDPDAAAYLNAVESADTQALEAAVRKAVDDFVKGLKADGIWSAIKASCILAGARTLTGALVPLVGSAPTNVSNLFVSGDYDREDGLIGVPANATRLDSNYNINSVGQDDAHAAVYVTAAPSLTATRGFAGGGNDQMLSEAAGTSFTTRFRASGANSVGNQATTTGLKGLSRNNSANYTRRSGQTNTTVTVTSAAPTSTNMLIFTRSANYTDARMSFYSLGEALDLAALETRVATLMSDIDAAI